MMRQQLVEDASPVGRCFQPAMSLLDPREFPHAGDNGFRRREETGEVLADEVPLGFNDRCSEFFFDSLLTIG